MNILRGGGGIHYLHTQKKKKTEHCKMPLSRNFPTALDAIFAQFALDALKSFRHPGGLGTHF